MKSQWSRRSLIAAGLAFSFSQVGHAGLLCRWRRRRARRCSSEASGKKPVAWRSLFDGKTLGKWKKTNFGGEGDVEVSDGKIFMDMGNPLTGVHYSGPMPTANYEVELEARRTAGIDFFCCLVFPIGKTHCSFVVAGWAGSIVGLSNINEENASENGTTKYMKFNDKQWYKIRLRVLKDDIQAWIDDKQVVNENVKGKNVSLHVAVEPQKPLGISCFQTRAEIRNIRMRKV